MLHCNPIVIYCNFTYNSTSSSGCGMYNVLSNPTITHCNFTSNSILSLGNGGWMSNLGSSPLISHCNFTSNKAGHWGGGIHYRTCINPTVIHCTFIGNQATQGNALTFSLSRSEGNSPDARARSCLNRDTSLVPNRGERSTSWLRSAQLIQSRSRKTLGFKTPYEVFYNGSRFKTSRVALGS